MTGWSTQELRPVFQARRVQVPDLRGMDAMWARWSGVLANRMPAVGRLRRRARRVLGMTKEIEALRASAFAGEVARAQELARRGKLDGTSLDRAMALAREAGTRALGLSAFQVQIMGALGLCEGSIVEMATGEGKTLTAALAASAWGLEGKPVHIITVNDYLVARDAAEMGPLYRMMGLDVGHVVHDTPQSQRAAEYRKAVVYVTQKELVADFLRDQIFLGQLKTSTQTGVRMLAGDRIRQMLIPGLWKVIVDEADSVLVDEAVTPLIISNSPEDEPNAHLYREADALALKLEAGRHFTIDRGTKQVELTTAGRDRLAELSGERGFWSGSRRREEMVVQALSAHHCHHINEHYLISEEGKAVIVDEFTGRVLKDRSWRHGLHQAVEVKEKLKVTADKENLARMSFQRFFRQYPALAGMTGTAWESRGEFWQIYRRRVVQLPTNRPCIRVQLGTRALPNLEKKWDAVVERVRELHDRGLPVLVGTRSVWASQLLSKRLEELGLKHNVLNAEHEAEEAQIVAEAGQPGQITVATNMAGRGTDIKLARNIAEAGGLHVIATEAHTSHRIDRQLFGRAARQGDPGCAQMFVSLDDDLFVRHAHGIKWLRWFGGIERVIRAAQARAERLARGNRRQVLRADDWIDEYLPF